MSLFAERPVIESPMSDQTALEGASVELDCDVSRGTPPLSVTWLHNALPLADDQQFIRVNSKSNNFELLHLRIFFPVTFMLY